jgi:hypothetical protein
MPITQEQWDAAFNQASGQAVPTPPETDPQGQQPDGQQQPGRTLDKQAVARQSDEEANGKQPTSLGDYAWDGAVGVAAGAESFGKSIGRLANDLAGTVGLKFADDSTFDNVIKTKTWAGALTSGITQFGLAFVPALGIAGRVGEAVGVTSKLATSLSAGALADFAGFSEKQGRLSDLLNQVPALKDSALTFLASKPDDNWAEARLKTAVEGLGLGAAAHVLFAGLVGMKGMMAAKNAGDAAGFAKASAETSTKVVKAMQVAGDAAGTGRATGAAGVAAEATSTPPLRNGVPDGLADKILEHIRSNPDKPFEVALDDAVQTHVNYGRLVTSDDVKGLQTLAQNVADKYITGLTESPMKLAAVKETADELAETFGQNPKLLWSAVAADEKSIDGVATRLVSYRIMRNTVGQALVNAAQRYALGATDTAAEAASPAVAETAAPAAAEAAVPSVAKLPRELSGAKPRYNYGQNGFGLQFQSDVDKALFITAQANKSARDEAYRGFLRQAGFTDAEIAESGAKVKAAIKDQAKGAIGGDSDTLVVNDSGAKPQNPAPSSPATADASQSPGPSASSDGLGRIGELAKAYMDLHKSVQVIQTEGARIPSFGRVLADTAGGFDPEKLAKLVGRTMQGGNGPLARQQLVRTIIASNGDPKSLVTLFNGLADNFGKRVLNPIVEYHTNSVLSGLTTQATKFLSDLTNAVVLPTERLLGGAWMRNRAVMESGGRMYTNIITSLLDWTHLSEAASRISDQQGSSMGRAFHAFVSGQPILDHLSDFQPQHAISAGNLGLSQGSWLGSAVNMIGKAVNLPQRMLMTMDEFWKQVNFRAYVRDEGIRLAQGQGLQGDEFASFLNNHIDKAFGPNGQSLNDAALSYAKMATFQNDLLPNTMGEWLQEGVNKHPALRLIMPFVKTPTNIFRRAWQMTPGLNLLQSEFRNMAMSADPIERATAYGRASLGGMLWTLAIGMAQTGKLTGGGPSNAKERAALQDSGWQPYSIVTKDEQGNKTYVSLKKLEPFADMLGLAADWKEAAGQMSDEDGDKTATAMLYAMAHSLSSKSYYSGLTEALNAMSQPDQKLQGFINNFAGSFVPAALAKANGDPYMRDAKTMMDAMRRRIPGLSDSLPPVRNILGEPVRVPGGYLPFGGDDTNAARMLSPFAESKQLPDDVHQELARLQYGFSKAPRQLQGFDLTGFHNAEGQDAYDRHQELTGQVKIGGQTMADALSRLVKSQRYQAMELPTQHGDDSNERVMAVRRLIADYRGRALQQVQQEYPQIGRAMQAYRQQSKGAATPSPVMQALGQQ